MADEVEIYFDDDDEKFYVDPGEVDLTNSVDRVITWQNNTDEQFTVQLPNKLGSESTVVAPEDESSLTIPEPSARGTYKYKVKSASGQPAHGFSDPRIRT